MLDSLVRVSRRVLKVPKAIASLIGVSRGLSENTVANSRERTESALGPIAIAIHVLATGRTRTESRPPAISKPSSELFGNQRVQQASENPSSRSSQSGP